MLWLAVLLAQYFAIATTPEVQEDGGMNIRSIFPPFRFVDLFAGIGGFHLAMESLGGKCVLASEIDAQCQAVYRQRWPDVPLVGDIREITADHAKAVPDHDVLCAGFPCQPFSKSGFQLGLRDKTRGTLFFEIMEVIRARHPRFVILENVRNIAGPRHIDTWRTIVASLREEGYRVSSEPLVFSPHLLPPELGGRPQIRERVFIVGEHVGLPPDEPVAPLLEHRPVGDWTTDKWSIKKFLQPDRQIKPLARYRLRPDEETWLKAWQEFIEVIDEDPLPGFPIWADAFTTRPRVTPDMPAWKADFLRKNSALYVRHKAPIDDWLDKWHGLKAFPPSRRKFEWQARGWPHDVRRLVIHFRPSGIRVKPPTYLPALVAITQTSVIGAKWRRITPREAARLQGFPDDFVVHVDDKAAYRQFGNAVNVGAAAYVARILMGGVFAPPLGRVRPVNAPVPPKSAAIQLRLVS